MVADKFKITIEVVPPEENSDALLKALDNISDLPFDAFSVASNPIAKPRLSAMVFAHLLQNKTGKSAILHFTIRDHNAIALQGEMWGAKALGIETVLAMTGDPAKAGRGQKTVSTVGDVNVYELIEMLCRSGFNTGAVLDFKPEIDGLSSQIKRLEKKVKSGARFVVTQPVYDEETAKEISRAARHLNVPVIMGVLPLLSHRHAEFLHEKVSGIAVPKFLRHEMKHSKDPVSRGILQAKHILDIARAQFSGACIMPPFDRFDILDTILLP